MKIVEKKKDNDWVMNKFKLLRYLLAYCIENELMQSIAFLCKYVDPNSRYLVNMTPLEHALKIYDPKTNKLEVIRDLVNRLGKFEATLPVN